MGKQRKLQIVVYFAFHSHTHTHIRRVVVRNETDTKGKSAQKTKEGNIGGGKGGRSRFK